MSIRSSDALPRSVAASQPITAQARMRGQHPKNFRFDAVKLLSRPGSARESRSPTSAPFVGHQGDVASNRGRPPRRMPITLFAIVSPMPTIISRRPFRCSSATGVGIFIPHLGRNRNDVVGNRDGSVQKVNTQQHRLSVVGGLAPRPAQKRQCHPARRCRVIEALIEVKAPRPACALLDRRQGPSRPMRFGTGFPGRLQLAPFPGASSAAPTTLAVKRGSACEPTISI